MRIAIFTDSFLPGVGGTEKAVLGLATALAENNEVVVCAPYYSRKYKDDFRFQVLRANSIKITNNDYFAFPFTSCKFKKELKKFNPEIIHCQSVSPMAKYALSYAKKHNIPVVMTVHTKFKTAFERSIKSKVIVNALIKNLVKKLNKVKQVYTVSNDMIDELKSYGYCGEVKVIRNGATFSRINNLEEVKKLAIQKYNLANEENIFLYVGHIVKFNVAVKRLPVFALWREGAAVLFDDGGSVGNIRGGVDKPGDALNIDLCVYQARKRVDYPEQWVHQPLCV